MSICQSCPLLYKVTCQYVRVFLSFTRLHINMSELSPPSQRYMSICQSCPLLCKVTCQYVRVVLSFARLHVDVSELSSPSQGYMSMRQCCPLLNTLNPRGSKIRKTRKLFYHFFLRSLRHGGCNFQSLTNTFQLITCSWDFPFFHLGHGTTSISRYTTAICRCQFDYCYRY